MAEQDSGKRPHRILSLDGGGSKGFYSLGVLKGIEQLVDCPLYQKFDLIFGTSTGAIIGSLLALGKTVDEITLLYKEHVPSIMGKKRPSQKSAALKHLADLTFQEIKFDQMKTCVGIVATRLREERPMIFKSRIEQAMGREASFSPGFGVSVSDAVQASCSAIPFFNRKIVQTDTGDQVELVDGGYCANNPTLYAITEAVKAFNIAPKAARVVSVGVGSYPPPYQSLLSGARWIDMLPCCRLSKKIFDINTQAMEQFQQIIFDDVPNVRISNTYEKPEMATDLFETNERMLNILRQCGADSFGIYEKNWFNYLIAKIKTWRFRKFN